MTTQQQHAEEKSWTDRMEREIRNPDANARSKTGWPADTGPLAALKRLGLIRDAHAQINWIRYPKTLLRDGVTIWKFSTRFLFEDAIRALAALSFEGYKIQIFPATNSDITVQLTESSTATNN